MVRHDAEQEKPRPPYLFMSLIAGAVTCQSLVLAGNMHTVHTLHRLGHSSGGWAATGLNLADSFGDFSTQLFRTSKMLAKAIDDILIIQEVVDTLVLNISTTVGVGAGSYRAVKGASPDTDSFIQVHLSVTGDSLGPHDEAASLGRPLRALPALALLAQGPCVQIMREAQPILQDLTPRMKRLGRELAPSLKRVHRWLNDLSDRAQSHVGDFSVTLGRVQELFDVVTDTFASESTSDQEMIEQTYNLFDTSNTGLVSLSDIGNVSHIYGITFLTGDRAASMFEQYDGNGDAMLDKGEFGRMMLDPSTPALMATVLHAYADRLAHVAGPLKRGETRIEVAGAVASYLQTVASKNMTKVGWMAQALTNGSLPMNFTVAVLNQLALAAEDPNKMLTVEAGAIMVRRMVDFNPSLVRRVLEFMVDPEAWVSEGLDPELQPSVTERVARWASNAGVSSGAAVCAALLGSAHVQAQRSTDESFSGRVQQMEKEMQVLPSLYRWRAERGSRSYAAGKRAAKARTADALMESERSKQLLEDLLGSALPASTQTSPQATRAIQKGKVAAPEVLQFAQWLANNASRTAAMLSTKCFDYSSRMSQHVQGLASKIHGVSDKVFMGLQLLMRYSSDSAVEDLVATFESFEERAPQDLLDICNRVMLEDGLRATLPPQSSWAKASRILQEIQSVLPGVIESLEVAQMHTASFSSSMSSTFQVMTIRLPVSFHLSAKVWKAFWVTYYILFLLVDLLMLAWIVWVNGLIASRSVESEEREGKELEEYQPPQTMRERLQVCFGSCHACLESRLVDGSMCFWSILIIIELIVFISFVFSLVLSMLAVVKVFVYSGCNQIYMLGDGMVCAEVMMNIKGWLTSFLNRDFLTPLTVCDERMLLTCDLISADLLKSSVLTVVGGFVGSFLNFQIVVESAILHERARWQKAMKEPQTEL